MSEDFKRLHDNFRFLKEKHGVDLTVPHGVGIDGKIYPATHKHIDIGSKGDEVPLLDSESRFYIPLENGLKVYSTTQWNGGFRMQAHVPTIHIDNNGTKQYKYGPALHKGEDSYYASFGENVDNYEERMSLNNSRGPVSIVHEVLNMWGKEPYQGTYDFQGKEGFKHFKKIKPNAEFSWADRDDLELTEDELNEHRQNIKGHPLSASHNVTVRGLHDYSNIHNYNTKTEQLRPLEDVFPDTFDNPWRSVARS